MHVAQNLTATYDRITLCVAGLALGERGYIWLHRCSHVNTVGAWCDYYMRKASSRERDRARAFIADFLPSGALDTLIHDFDPDDLEARLNRASSECARLLFEIDRPRMLGVV